MDRNTIADITAYRLAGALVATAGQPTEARFRAVARSGSEIVVNLALHDDPRYSLPDEPGLVRSYGMEYECRAITQIPGASLLPDGIERYLTGVSMFLLRG